MRTLLFQAFEEADAKIQECNERNHIPFFAAFSGAVIGNGETHFKLGDIITFDATDNRTWWQRHAPLWLGGKRAPMLSAIITEVKP
jgi:hypothetical protein